MKDIYEMTAEERRQHAAELIDREIDKLRDAVARIDAIDRRYPDAPVGTAWMVARSAFDKLNAILNGKDRDAA